MSDMGKNTLVLANGATVASGSSVGHGTGTNPQYDDCRGTRYWGVSAYSDKTGTLTISYSVNGITWHTLKAPTVIAGVPYDEMFDRTRDFYKVEFSQSSGLPATVTLATVRNN